MAILAYLGWDASPIARLDRGRTSEAIRADLARWNVNDRWLAADSPVPPPVYVERLRRHAGGGPHHRFERHCPECGSRLPQHRPVTRRAISGLLDEIAACDVLYIDRPSAGAVAAASRVRACGPLVVFEPSARGKRDHLATLAELAHIVKYSGERLTGADRAVIAEASRGAEIETLGAEGLRFRTGRAWHHISALPIDEQDTAGAGDWTTAGFLHRLLPDLAHSRQPTLGVLREALADAQALAAVSCLYPGARGAMERNTPEEILAAARSLRHGDRQLAGHRPGAAAAERPEDFACIACG